MQFDHITFKNTLKIILASWYETLNTFLLWSTYCAKFHLYRLQYSTEQLCSNSIQSLQQDHIRLKNSLKIILNSFVKVYFLSFRLYSWVASHICFILSCTQIYIVEPLHTIACALNYNNNNVLLIWSLSYHITLHAPNNKIMYFNNLPQ